MRLSMKIPLPLAVLLLIALQLAGFAKAQPTAAAVGDALNITMASAIPVLLKNISTFSGARTFYASPFVMYASRGFPVVLGASSTPHAVVAAAQLDSGSRVVAFGHESMVTGCCSTGDAIDKLAVNAFNWLSGSQPGRTSLKIATLSSSYSTALTAIGKAVASMLKITVTTSVLTVDKFATAAGTSLPDIYWIDSYTTYTAAQVTALLSFANKTGRGLIVTGHAWYWSYSHDENPLTGHPVNAVLWPLGLGLTTDYDSGYQEPSYTAKNSSRWLFYNANYTLCRVVEAARGVRALESTMYGPASECLNQLLTILPGQYSPALPATASNKPFQPLWDFLFQAKNASAPAVGPNKPFTVKGAHPSMLLEPAIDAAITRNGDITNLKPSKSAPLYPGMPFPNTSKPSPDPITLTINTTYTGVMMGMPMSGSGDQVWRSTGLYAPAGAIVNVTVEAKGVGKGLLVQVGAHTDWLDSKDVWYRVPRAVASWKINSAIMSVGSPLGGLIFIVVPKGLMATVGSLQITIRGALRAPYYKHNVTAAAEWANTIRYYPAPWAELDNGKIVLMVPSAAIRNMTDPAPLMEHWAKVMDGMAWLSNMSPDRPRAERFLVDADISAGWMHNGYPIMAYDDPGVWQELLNVTYVKKAGAWGPFHELGHNHQWSDMQFSGTGESFNNLFSVYTEMEVLGFTSTQIHSSATPTARAAARKKYLSSGAKWSTDWNVWVALDTYLQLQEGFGWSFYRNVFAAYQKATTSPTNAVQTWIQVTSKVANRNLVPFYSAWGFPVSQATKDAVSTLPAWTANPMTKIAKSG
ncbi:hypothetical protein Agub_g3812 [Astrephomene gubernaculifera]|uniref:Peptidase M60 domain-containing protein n=1 Tax=Astrephomene gubernaculifera TaxID=47775 RepID=A0AAD3DJ92_9CHLO|nr:hypothetical protein Agub_g3812 [Astrephomene gubernaculifera]